MKLIIPNIYKLDLDGLQDALYFEVVDTEVELKERLINQDIPFNKRSGLTCDYQSLHPECYPVMTNDPVATNRQHKRIQDTIRINLKKFGL